MDKWKDHIDMLEAKCRNYEDNCTSLKQKLEETLKIISERDL
jgi:hypothetical protein